jgi:uncharacterized protein YlxW (UPF0749 family)
MPLKTGRKEIALICIIVGILIILQMRTVSQIEGILSTDRAIDLAAEVNTLTSENESLKNEIEDLNEKITAYELEVSDGTTVEELQEDIEEQEIMAGVTDVTGEGIIIEIDADTSKDYDPVLYSNSSEMLLLLVNELNAAGAEAVSINGERIVMTTEIRQGGNYVNINRNQYSIPFEVKVIGDQETLLAAINMNAGIVDIMESNSFVVNIEEDEEVEIEKYNGVIDIQYAQPVDEE